MELRCAANFPPFLVSRKFRKFRKFRVATGST
jgi:hypothetical protein